MELTINGGSYEQRKWCHEFIEHVIVMLCGKRLANVITLDVTLSDSLHKKSGILGSCMFIDDLTCPREFEIDIDSTMKMRWLLVTLAHELVHVKQYAKKELRLLERFPGYSYQGKRYRTDHVTSDFDANCTPWEIEARGLEESLFVEWAQSNNVTAEWTLLDIFAQ